MSRKATTPARKRPWVIKIGSALLTDEGRGLDRESIRVWVDQMSKLRNRGVDVVLVSSGSIVEGISRLGLKKRPEAVYELQALAAVGQMGLIQVYESCFQAHGTHTAQILLTHEDVAHRGRYLNARSTLRTLLRYGVVPVVNENDTVA
ncbi:MAG TPA: glutamate 5-kinase, partial [Gammaproteobacteria bacterium]|nr:glutamate 5-kinase [Gammaproteobacteria bacterium]